MKQRIGAVAFMVGLVGCGFAAGAEPETVKDWITVVGVAFTSLMCAQMGVWMIKDEI